MVGGRPYRTAILHHDAIAELRRMAGVQFDPELVQVFVEQFPDSMPWEPERHDHDHGPGTGDRHVHRHAPIAARGRTTAQHHDAVHAARRRAV
jgi:hypothetical protein